MSLTYDEALEGIQACEHIPKNPSVAWLRQQLKKLDKGLLYSGAHESHEHEFCALEFVNTLRDGCTLDGRGFTQLDDSPEYLPDLRELNDNAGWKSDKDRTNTLLPLISALWNYTKWSRFRYTRFNNIINKKGRKFAEDVGDLFLGDGRFEFLDLCGYPKTRRELGQACRIILEAVRASSKSTR